MLHSHTPFLGELATEGCWPSGLHQAVPSLMLLEPPAHQQAIGKEDEEETSTHKAELEPYKDTLKPMSVLVVSDLGGVGILGKPLPQVTPHT